MRFKEESNTTKNVMKYHAVVYAILKNELNLI